MQVYLIHFKTNLSHARHYIGFCEEDPKERLETHRAGHGARILQVANERGIEYEIARVWKGKDRKFERKLKNRKDAKRLCPVCSGKDSFRFATK